MPRLFADGTSRSPRRARPPRTWRAPARTAACRCRSRTSEASDQRSVMSVDDVSFAIMPLNVFGLLVSSEDEAPAVAANARQLLDERLCRRRNLIFVGNGVGRRAAAAGARPSRRGRAQRHTKRSTSSFDVYPFDVPEDPVRHDARLDVAEPIAHRQLDVQDRQPDEPGLLVPDGLDFLPTRLLRLRRSSVVSISSSSWSMRASSGVAGFCWRTNQ